MYTIESVEPGTGYPGVAAIVKGNFTAPSFRDGDFIARDAAGTPKPNGTFTTGFVLALPKSATSTPARGMVPARVSRRPNPEVALFAGRRLGRSGFCARWFHGHSGPEIIRESKMGSP